MDVELKAIEANNRCLEQEVRAKEIAEAQRAQDAALLEAACKREETALRALNMAKLQMATEAQAIQTEEEALRADARAVVAARRRIEAAGAAKAAAERSEQEALAIEELERCNAGAAAEQAELLAQKRAEQAQLAGALAQKNALALDDIAAVRKRHDEIKRTVQQIAEENTALLEEISRMEAAVLPGERKKNAQLKAVLQQENAMLETDMLLGKLRRSMRFARGTQAIFALTLLLAGGLWLMQPPTIIQPAVAALDAPQAQALATPRGPVESFKLSTELSHLPLQMAAVE